MKMKNIGFVIGIISLLILMPEMGFAFGGFESRMESLTRSLITIVMPALSILGLIYASILAIMGDGAAKSRIVTVLVCSVIGFLAPLIIKWLQYASGY